MSTIVLEASPGLPIPACCTEAEAGHRGGEDIGLRPVGGAPGGSAARGLRRSFPDGSAVGGDPVLPPDAADEHVTEPWVLRGHRIQQAEVVDANGEQLDSLIFCTQCGSYVSYTSRDKAKSRCYIFW